MKRINFTVDFIVDLPDHTDPDDVTFEIPMEQVEVYSDRTRIQGELVEYCTQEIWEQVGEHD